MKGNEEQGSNRLSKLRFVKDSSKLVPPAGHVYIAADGSDGMYDMAKGIFIDVTYNPQEHLATTGEVVAFSKELPFNRDQMNKEHKKSSQVFSLPYKGKVIEGQVLHPAIYANRDVTRMLTRESVFAKVPVEIEVGDRVWFNYLVWADMSDTQRTFYCDKTKKLIICVRYDKLIMAKRNDEFIPLNGYCILEQLYEEVDENGMRPDGTYVSIKDPIRMKAIVRYVGTPPDRYFSYNEPIAGPVDISVGDEVVYNGSRNAPIQSEMYREEFDERDLIFVPCIEILGKVV